MAAQIILAQTSRQGTYMSASYLVPTSATWVKVAADIDDAHLIAVGKSLKVAIESSVDNGLQWTPRYAFNWEAPSEEQPFTEVPGSAFHNMRVRAVLDVPSAMRVGATIEIV